MEHVSKPVKADLNDSLIEYLNKYKFKPNYISSIHVRDFTGDYEGFDKKYKGYKEKLIKNMFTFDTDIEEINGDTYIKIVYRSFSPKNYKSTKEARGIILKYDKDTEKYTIVAHSFDRFFNHCESDYVDNFKFDDTVKVQLKLDGSLIMLWFCKSDEKWYISTRGKIIPEKKYKKLTLELLNKYNIDFDKLIKDYTYTFELCSLKNISMIRYNTPELYHIGTRCIKTGIELIDEYIGVQKPKIYEYHTFEDILNVDIKGIEGFVVVKPIENEGHLIILRQKMKMDSYLNMKNKKKYKLKNIVTKYFDGYLQEHYVKSPENIQYKKAINVCDIMIDFYIKNYKDYIKEYLIKDTKRLAFIELEKSSIQDKEKKIVSIIIGSLYDKYNEKIKELNKINEKDEEIYNKLYKESFKHISGKCLSYIFNKIELKDELKDFRSL